MKIEEQSVMIREKITMDGNTAAAHVAYAYSEIAAIYPITPSSTMAEITDEWAHTNRKNIFGKQVDVVELESEAGAAATVHGALMAGALTTTFTASQGLLLMIPNLYKMTGEQLPGVFHVAARAIATHALSIFGDHSDVYAVRQTGAVMLSTSSVQEVMDLAPVAHLAAIQASIPVIHFFDGFRTSHEIQKIEAWDYATLASFIDKDALDLFRRKALNPEHAKLIGQAQNPDTFFQVREATNPLYAKIPTIVENYMHKINETIGTDYELFQYYGDPCATHIIIAMGSVCDTIRATVDCLNENGMKTGVVCVHLYRPFSAVHLLQAIPDTVNQITVLDRTKEPGAAGEPLYLDVVAALRGSSFEHIPIYSGRYGLGSKDTTAAQIREVFLNEIKPAFTLGIMDDITNLSLPVDTTWDIVTDGITSAKFWGIGSDGTVSANKNSIKIIGNYTDLAVQAYFSYDSKKSGGLTISHLRFGTKPIRQAYYVHHADFVACHNQTYIGKYDMVQELNDGGTFLLNCTWDDVELEKHLPNAVKQYIATHQIRFFTINGVAIAKEIGLNRKINTILQAAFFALTNVLSKEDAVRYMKEAAYASYGKKGEKIVQMNERAIDAGMEQIHQVEVPSEWYTLNETEPATALSEKSMYIERAVCKSSDSVHPMSNSCDGLPPECHECDMTKDKKQYIEQIQDCIAKEKGDMLPVSAFVPFADGHVPSGTSAYERRDIALELPKWKPEYCIQCNRCAYVCPHSVIRPFVLKDVSCKDAVQHKDTKPIQKANLTVPIEGITGGQSPYPLLDMTGVPNHKFAITISAVDCTGCGVCAEVCPGMKQHKALEMTAKENFSQAELDTMQAYADYQRQLPVSQEVSDKFSKNTVKGSQFTAPLLEFSGACPGCGETPYAKLITQLFGTSMYIANATGCSSIWANSSPASAYSCDSRGNGPAWANSLFEDAAEFGYGMLLAQKNLRKELYEKLCVIKESHISDMFDTVIDQWMHTFDDRVENEKATKQLVNCIYNYLTNRLQRIAQENVTERLSLSKILENQNKEDIVKNKDVRDMSTQNIRGHAFNDGHIYALLEDIYQKKQFLAKKSQWIFGGDGWAYDIGFGGLDHVLASGENINVLVFDTELYSNTGGQAAKSSPTATVAKFASGGKVLPKKNLAAIAMRYGYVYVAQISMGADYTQCIRAMTEAEHYNGPSLIIAYAPCINHGIKKGMRYSQEEMKLAVESGYWDLFRYHPSGAEDGHPLFTLDSKEPTCDYRAFLDREVRFTSLQMQNPQQCEQLYTQAEEYAAHRRKNWIHEANFAEK